ncbi:hypothetical protein FBY35_6408 [Streptomyces sp. SLBN-118]|uniref:hypothetical protein n=1 Tax=Streptomyces sp. SLBN-118 TaxID=2768454 RepID=UPI00115138E2|nr:hypothetical protein [Streptomyces sp. SLBN-118]TQK44875.1 hypothetical protein FBY35_6408 [Streptomyces sp. SLBN-118]
MRTMLRMLLMPVVAMAVTAGCSSDSDGGDRAQGKPAGEVCGAFAKDPTASAAIKAIAGEGNFRSNLSEPGKVLDTLREAARTEHSGKQRMQGIPFCWLLQANGGEADLRIEFREAAEVPERDARLKVTYFSTGERASSSDSLASVYFKCRMKAPAHEIVIAAQLRGPEGNKAPDKDIRTHQTTVVNAAARKVAADLGCQNDTKLVSGAPKPAA